MSKFNYFFAALCFMSFVHSMEITQYDSKESNEEQAHNPLTTMAQGVFVAQKYRNGALINSSLYLPSHHPARSSNHRPSFTTSNIFSTTTTPEQEDQQNPSSFVKNNRDSEIEKRAKKIKKLLINKRAVFINDKAAHYLAKKTIQDTDEELEGFMDGIADELAARGDVASINLELAQEAVVTRRMLAQKVKMAENTGSEISIFIKNLQKQRKKDKKQNQKDLKKIMTKQLEILEKSQQSNIWPYVYATAIYGATFSGASLLLYQIHNGHYEKTDGNNQTIKVMEETIKQIKNHIETSGSTPPQQPLSSGQQVAVMAVGAALGSIASANCSIQ